MDSTHQVSHHQGEHFRLGSVLPREVYNTREAMVTDDLSWGQELPWTEAGQTLLGIANKVIILK